MRESGRTTSKFRSRSSWTNSGSFNGTGFRFSSLPVGIERIQRWRRRRQRASLVTAVSPAKLKSVRPVTAYSLSTRSLCNGPSSADTQKEPRSLIKCVKMLIAGERRQTLVAQNQRKQKCISERKTRGNANYKKTKRTSVVLALRRKFLMRLARRISYVWKKISFVRNSIMNQLRLSSHETNFFTSIFCAHNKVASERNKTFPKSRRLSSDHQRHSLAIFKTAKELFSEFLTIIENTARNFEFPMTGTIDYAQVCLSIYLLIFINSTNRYRYLKCQVI